MKRALYTMLLATALTLPASYASAQIGISTNAGTSVGVNTTASGSTNRSTSMNNGPTSSIGAGVNGTLGVDGTRNNPTRRTTNSTANNSGSATTGAGTSATINSGTNDTTRLNYSNDSSVRTNRDQNAVNRSAAGIASSTQGSILSTTDLDSSSVRNIQKSLNDRGYNVGNVDGKWNTSTAAELRRFETNQGLTASSGTSLNARSLNELGVNVGAGANVNNITPSSGSRIMTPSVRSGVNGSASYNQ